MRSALVILVLCASPLLAQVAASWEAARPVLEKHCIRCHFPGKMRGGLDLTTREALLRGGKHGPVVDSTQPAEGLLLASVRGTGRTAMPWKEDPLPPENIAVLEAWVAAGVPMDPPPRAPRATGSVTEGDRALWSFAPLKTVAPPVVEGSTHPVDAFLLAALHKKGLSFAPRASDEVLSRRAHILLTGLPRSAGVPPAESRSAGVPPAESRSAGVPPALAWDQLVERLIASPQFGERMARHWLDVARYADSNGYEFDEERPHAWPYRDYVVKAFNDDQRADEFIRWQLAGDEIAPDNRWARAATGFLAAGPVNGNEDNEGTRYTELDDVLSTTSSAFLGLSMGCARCHDHKYDALPTADYYGMLAAFVTTRRTESPFVEAAEEAEYQSALKRHEDKVQTAATALKTHLDAARAAGAAQQGTQIELQWRYTFTEPAVEWLLPEYDDSGWQQGPGGFGTRGTPGAVISTEWTSERIWLRREFVWEGEASDFALVAHHDDTVHVYLNGTLVADARGYTTDYETLHVTDFGRERLKQGKNTLSVFCLQDFGGQYIDVRPVKRSALQTRSARELALEGRPADPDAGLDAAARERRDVLAAALAAAKRSKPRQPARVMHLHDHAAAADTAHLLRRGNPEDKEAEIGFMLPQVLPGGGDAAAWVEKQRAARAAAQLPPTTLRRAALAAWMTDPEHGAGALVARVLVNRVWQWHFGRGLVASPNDFGIQAAKPLHPELLEWLAAELVRNQWSLKHIHRLLATSAAWQQSCEVSEAARALDPDGALLSHRRMLRLDGETLRDAVLSVSGSLNLTMGGPAVKPWVHSDAIATGSTEKWPKNVVDGPATWRRSIYVFMRRSVRFPLFECFDAPDAQASCGQRVPTVTPLQSLAMMNNEFIGAQAALLAQRVEKVAGLEPPAFARCAIAAAFSRPATAAELERSIEFLLNGDAARRAAFCQALLGANAFLYLE